MASQLFLLERPPADKVEAISRAAQYYKLVLNMRGLTEVLEGKAEPPILLIENDDKRMLLAIAARLRDAGASVATSLEALSFTEKLRSSWKRDKAMGESLSRGDENEGSLLDALRDPPLWLRAMGIGLVLVSLVLLGVFGVMKVAGPPPESETVPVAKSISLPGSSASSLPASAISAEKGGDARTRSSARARGSPEEDQAALERMTQALSGGEGTNAGDAGQPEKGPDKKGRMPLFPLIVGLTLGTTGGWRAKRTTAKGGKLLRPIGGTLLILLAVTTSFLLPMDWFTRTKADSEVPSSSQSLSLSAPGPQASSPPASSSAPKPQAPVANLGPFARFLAEHKAPPADPCSSNPHFTELLCRFKAMKAEGPPKAPQDAPDPAAAPAPVIASGTPAPATDEKAATKPVLASSQAQTPEQGAGKASASGESASKAASAPPMAQAPAQRQAPVQVPIVPRKASARRAQLLTTLDLRAASIGLAAGFLLTIGLLRSREQRGAQ